MRARKTHILSEQWFCFKVINRDNKGKLHAAFGISFRAT